MVLTVQNIITDAMGLIGAVAADETPTTSENTLALRVANTMIDRWSSQRLLLRSSTTLDFTLVANKAEYTIGASGADIAGGKPIRLISAYYTDSSSLDTQIDVIEKITYDSLGDKNITFSRPMYIAYDPQAAQQTVQKGTFFIYPIPDVAYTMHAEVDNYLTEFVNLTDNITFEPAYYEALIYNLAVRLWRYFHDGGTSVPLDIVAIATESLTNLRNMNSVQFLAGMELPGKTARYNIYTDVN